jgi:hypothetical protein
LKPSDPDAAIDRDVFMYRAYLALQKFAIVKDEIGANSPQLIQPLKVSRTSWITGLFTVNFTRTMKTLLLNVARQNWK